MFDVVAGKQAFVGNDIQSNLGEKDPGFDSSGTIKLVRYTDFRNGGVVHVSGNSCWYGNGGGVVQVSSGGGSLDDPQTVFR